MRRSPFVLSVALALPLLGCHSVDKTGTPSRGFYSADFDSLWEVGELALQEQGFAPDREGSSKETKTLVSRWSMKLHPFYGKGYREQATVIFHPAPTTEKRWNVEVNVLREYNSEMTQPTNPVLADWEDGVRNPQLEKQITYRIERYFISHDVSAQFRAETGMPSKAAQPADEPKPKPLTPAEETDWTAHTR